MGRNTKTISRILIVAMLPLAAILVPALPASAAGGYSGYATATILHADALQSGDMRVVDAQEGFSGASVNSGGLSNAVLDEMERQTQPVQAGKKSYAHGSGVEAGLAHAPSAENQLILAGKAESAAPPTSDPVTKEVGPVKGSPLLYVSALRGQSVARWNTGSCVIGEDIARGLGYAVDAQVLNTGAANDDGTLQSPVVAADAPGPERAVAQSSSRLTLIRQVDKNGHIVGPRFGLMSETRETIAPITLFRGMPQQITLEFLGEWVLQAVATGVPGQAYVHYGPGKVNPETPVLRTLDILGNVTNLLTTQQLLTDAGLVLKVPGVAEIAIGEDARAIGGDDTSAPATAGNGTMASAAVDVVRVKLLPTPMLHLADVRVGHMEVRAQVPEGGIECPVPVKKVPVPASVSVGGTFTTTITVTNPFNCVLKDVEVTDHVTVEGDARFHIDGTEPDADAVTGGSDLSVGDIEWNNIGSIAAHGTKSVKATFLAQGGAGKIIDTAHASGTLGNCNGSGQTVAGVTTSVVGAGVNGSSEPTEVSVSKVLGRKIDAGQLPATGLKDGMYAGAGLAALLLACALGVAVRRS